MGLMLLSNINIFAQQSIKSVYFNNDSHKLNTETKSFLLDSILIFKNAKLEIKGYSDVNGVETYNQKLSQNRANSVKSFLINNGIDSTKIVLVKGMGESSEFTDLSKNRRVDIFVTQPLTTKTIKKDSLPIKKVDTSLVSNRQTKPNNLDNIINLKVGQTIVLKNIQFYPGRDQPLPKAIPDLKKLVKIMQDNPNLKIEIQGHICCMECNKNTEHTLKVEESSELSIKRARYVYYFLVNSGIEKDRLSYKGFGSCKPRVAEINERAMQMNRRVEIMVVDK